MSPGRLGRAGLGEWPAGQAPPIRPRRPSARQATETQFAKIGLRTAALTPLNLKASRVNIKGTSRRRVTSLRLCRSRGKVQNVLPQGRVSSSACSITASADPYFMTRAAASWPHPVDPGRCRVAPESVCNLDGLVWPVALQGFDLPGRRTRSSSVVHPDLVGEELIQVLVTTDYNDLQVLATKRVHSVASRSSASNPARSERARRSSENLENPLNLRLEVLGRGFAVGLVLGIDLLRKTSASSPPPSPWPDSPACARG